MKKSKSILVGIILIIAIMTLSGCGDSKTKENSKIKIGINQLMEHQALDDARQGFEDGLKELGVDAEIIYKNAQGDLGNSMSISKKYVDEKVDLIYAIGTPSAQTTKQATSEIPVLFSAVTDPVQSGLVSDWNNVGGNLSGTSDMAPIQEQLRLFRELDPKINKLGIIYNTGESNSEVQIKEVKKHAKDLNLEIVTVGVTDINDVPQNLDHLLSKVDALYVLSDNMIASSVSLIQKKLIENQMISICAEESQVKGGILLTMGLSYYDLGRQTAKMAEKILVQGKNIAEMPVELSNEQTLKVNTKTLEALGLSKDMPPLKDAIFIEN